jgi:2-C-methyl-D-erythritol 4-phosphate cytidylyltransferase / 2-C-methyl-D-erythritol 2,4-cyclodiphosphate synthase
MKVIALIVAGGEGARFAASVPKQYVNNILRDNIKKFLSCQEIDAVQVVIRPQDVELYNKAILDIQILPACFGESTRSGSVKQGLIAIKHLKPDLVLVHDANRPFLSVNLIQKIIQVLKENPYHGVIPVLSINDTVKHIEDGITKTIDRNLLKLVQTPQGFYFDQLFSLYESSLDACYTDESSLMENNNMPMIYIEGESTNIKITYQSDCLSVKNMKEVRSGIGFDAHRFCDSKDVSKSQIILGGVKIDFDKKIEAHSDGDVLIHALVDALLGCIGEGDIGLHFPPSDEKWKNANSEIFLLHVKKLLQNKNAVINNIDITVICEKPKISQQRIKIKENLSKMLEISENRVNIKATTTERMGFTGRGEGIAVQAIATILLP